mgnify:CR=1 FL=1
MFKFLKEKLSTVFSKIKKKVEEEVPIEEKDVVQEQPVAPQKKAREKKKKKDSGIKEPSSSPSPAPVQEEPLPVAVPPSVPEEKPGFISRFFKRKPTEEKVEKPSPVVWSW